MKRLLLLIVIFAIVASGCDRLREDAGGAGDSSPSPEPAEATFELQGVVVEASGSAAVTGTRQETTRTPVTPSPTSREGGVTSTARAAATPRTSPTQVTTPVIERAAPGSIALKLTSFTANESPCGFQEGDVLVVAFTRSTTFEPQELTQARGFPNNLQGLTLDISGRVVGDECLLLATAVGVVQGGEDEPDKKASPSPTSARRTPSPTPSG